MSDEDLRRAIEFLVEQQSRYSARLDQDESRLARLEDAYTTLGELARDANKQLMITPKPPRQQISDAEFRRRLKTITKQRKERLAELRSKNLH